jgi:hypothetical protein
LSNFFQVKTSLLFTRTQYFYSTYTRFVGEFIVEFFTESEIVSLLLFFITFQNIEVFWNCACEENSALSIQENLLFLHVYTQTRTHTPVAHFGKSHNTYAQLTTLLGSWFILGTITLFFKSIIPVITANLMYNIIDNQPFLQPPLIYHREPNTVSSTKTSV